MLDRQVYSVVSLVWSVRVVSMLIRNGSDVVIRYQTADGVFQPGMMGRCRESSVRLEHINETGFAPVPLANKGHRAVALHVPISWLKAPVKLRR